MYNYGDLIHHFQKNPEVFKILVERANTSPYCVAYATAQTLKGVLLQSFYDVTKMQILKEAWTVQAAL